MVIPTVVGIFSQSVSMLERVFKALLSTEPWLRDPEVLRIPYESKNLPMTGKLTLGMFGFDHIVLPHPPVERAMRYVAKAMAAEKHEVSEPLGFSITC
jgi:amidase